jgi:hypothetical protein
MILIARVLRMLNSVPGCRGRTRRAVREALTTAGQGAWMQYAGFVETGNSDSSQTIDEIVYGRKD